MPDFYTVVTDTGLQALGLASTQGQSFSLTHAVVGDGNGLAVVPNKGMTNLVHEVWRGRVAGIKVDPKEPSTYIFEFAIPADTGGFTIREVGLMDENGKLFCIGNFPETEKPVAANGSVRDLVVRLPLHFENAGVVNLVIDASIVLATKQDIVDHNEDPQAHRLATTAQTGFVRLATDTEHIAHTRKNIAATPWGVWKLLESVMSNFCSSDSTLKIATSNAVYQVFNRIEAHKTANDPHGLVAKIKALLSSSITSTSTTTFATPKAVKTVQDNLSTHNTSPQAHRLATEGQTGFVQLATAAQHVPSALHARKDIAATPFGVWDLFIKAKSDSVDLASTWRFATSLAVKTVMDALNGHKSANDPHGIIAKLQSLLSSSITNASTTTFATPKAVKLVRDLIVGHTGNTALHASGAQQVNIRTFTSSGKYTKPSNLIAAEVYVTGGGGSSGRLYNYASGGGGAGGTSIRTYSAAELFASEAVTVGAGGAEGGDGHDGGTSIFKVQNGYGGKKASIFYGNGGAGGNAVNGHINLKGGAGSTTSASGVSAAGGDTFWGGAGGGTNGAYSETNGVNGSGAGGRDSESTSGGNGGNGLVVIKEYLRNT